MSLRISKWRECCKTLFRNHVTSQVHLLLVRTWTVDSERLRTSIRAAGLSVRFSRVDFPAALHAALSWGSFDAVLYDPETPSISFELVTNALRERNLAIPIITIDSDDMGNAIASQLHSRRN